MAHAFSGGALHRILSSSNRHLIASRPWILCSLIATAVALDAARPVPGDKSVVTIAPDGRRYPVHEIGISELKTRAAEILRSVRDEGFQYLITYRGRPVGILPPLSEPPSVVPDRAA
jgi:prevent-host-death family protein